METALENVGYWAGLNFYALLRACVGGVVIGLTAFLIWRKIPERKWVFGAVGFLSVFGFVTARLTAGQTYLRTDDRAVATGAQLVVLLATIVLTTAVVLLRKRPKIAALVGFISVVCIGNATPIAVSLTPRSVNSVAVKKPTVSGVPAGYPTAVMWMNRDAGFGARFPTDPTRIGVAGVESSAYAYQSAFTFEDGGALAGVTVAPLPFNLDAPSQRSFLAQSHKGFLQSLGANVETPEIEWALFGNGAPTLLYQAQFTHDGLVFLGKGFWIVDRERAVRVAVTYPRDISPRSAAIAEYFLNTFVLIGDSTLTATQK